VADNRPGTTAASYLICSIVPFAKQKFFVPGYSKHTYNLPGGGIYPFSA
jgi:hypothetical protein